jgi:N,N'-diacetyllegionaminate synthase
MKKTLIIAEAGVNHNGDINLAKKLIDVAASCGADMVKFQTFSADSLATKNAKMAKYQIKNTKNDEAQQNMLSRLELSEDDHESLIDYCKLKKIEFLSTGFDIQAIDFLIKKNIKLIKIPSGNLTDLPYLKKIAQKNMPVILSTGMANLQEVSDAVSILINNGLKKELLTLLHCTTQYPAPHEDINLMAIETMRTKFDLEIGYSDHTLGIEASIAAVALGASVIEKHFTLSRNFDGPDHKASLEPDELKTMVKSIRNIELSMGNGIKEPSQHEKENIAIARKSIVASQNILKGELYSDKNITSKRPGCGLSPMLWDDLIGKPANQSYNQDDLIEL